MRVVDRFNPCGDPHDFGVVFIQNAGKSSRKDLGVDKK